MKSHKATKTIATRWIVFFFQMLSSDKNYDVFAPKCCCYTGCTCRGHQVRISHVITEGQISVDANCCHCFKGNTAELNNEEDSCLWQTWLRTDPRKRCKGDGNVKWKSKKPNKKIRNSKTAEQNDGVRREGFFHMAASTKTLPVMHIGISRALRTLFGMITEVSKGEDSSSLSNPWSIISTVEFAILKFSILSNVSLQRETAYYFL